MTTGEKIKQLRNSIGYSQERLAEELNVSRSAVAKWETDGGIPEIDNLLRLSSVFGISVDELVGSTVSSDDVEKPAALKFEAHGFGDMLHDIELTGWNDGVYGVYIIAEDRDFLYYYRCSDKARSVYGMIGKKYITSVLPNEEKAPEKPCTKEIGREFFCGRPVRIALVKREGLVRWFFDFRDDAYRNVTIRSFEEDTLQLQFGGTLHLTDIAKIEELNDQ